MLLKHKSLFGAGRHGKRQLGPPLTDSAVPPGIPTPPSEPPPISSTSSIPPSATTVPRTTLSVLPIPSNFFPTEPLPTNALPSSLPSSPPSESSNPQSIPSQATAPPAPFPQQSASSSASLPSEITSMFTTLSDSHPVTITTVIRPAASLSPDDHSSDSFLDNKAKTGAVFTVVALIVLAGVGFLGYRFYKTVQRRNADRETEEAARAAAKIRVRLDDYDEDASYGGTGSVFSPNMAQLRNEPHSIHGDSNFHPGEGMGEFDDVSPAPPRLPLPVLLHEPAGSLHMQAALDSFGLTVDGYDVPDSARSRKSYDSRDHLLLTRSNTPGGLHANTSEPVTPSPTQSSRPPTSPSSGHPPSETLGSTHTSTSAYIPRAQSVRYSERPPPPILPLPAAFGEGERRSVDQTILGDHEDYHGTRILKIANE